MSPVTANPKPAPISSPDEDEPVDTAALGRVEVVADQGGDERARGGGDRAEEDAGEQELAEVPDRRAPEHCRAPEHDDDAERPRAADTVGENAERQGGERGHQRGDRDEQPDVGVRDVQAVAQLGRGSADGGRVRRAQSEDAGEQDDDAHALRASEVVGERALRRTP